MGALTEQHLLRAAVVLSRGEAMCDLSDWPEKKRREANGSRVKRGLWRDGESVMGLTEARVQRGKRMTCHHMEGGVGILYRGSIVTARAKKEYRPVQHVSVLQAVYLIKRPELSKVRTRKHVFN